MSDEVESERLRALAALMRETGVTKLTTPDGFVLERPLASPLEQLVGAATTSTTPPKDEEEEAIEAEEREAKELPKRWARFWGSVTRSSGGAIPPYPGPERAARYLAAYDA